MAHKRRWTQLFAAATLAIATSACAGGGSASPPAAASVSAAPTTSAVASTTLAIEAPASVKAGATISVTWTGVPVLGDYLTIVAAGATAATPDYYVNISGAGPATLTAPATPGAYEIWWVTGDTLDGVKVRRPLAVN